MRRENINNKVFTRRAIVLGGIEATLFGVLAGRMYFLQVVESEQYSLLAEENRINMRLIPPPRGRILDRFGDEIASNQRNYRIVLVPEQTRSVKETLEMLSRIFPLDTYERSKVLRDAARRRSFVPVTVAENLTWEQFASVNVNSPDLPGVQSEIGESRYYPYGSAFAHVVGYVGAVSEKDLTGEPLLELPGFRIGKTGVENTYEENLRGKAGVSRVEVNAYGRVIRELNRKEGRPGSDVSLTLDTKLQRFVSNLLGDASASAVVLDVHSGDILSMVSSPSFNPHSFDLGISKHEWQRLLADERNPMLNKAVGGQYPPGSTFKMVVALAALNNKVINLSSEVFCQGYLELGDQKFHCWKDGGHGHISLLQAIERSCDCYFYEISRRLGIDSIAEMAKRFGLGSSTGVRIPAEKIGNIPTREWKAKNIRKPWQQGETLIAGIGQGYVLATPLQLAVMTARLANGGRAVQPRLMKTDGEPRVVKSLGIPGRWLEAVLKGMNLVSNSPWGTAYRARLEDQRWLLAGKTGTSQVRSISLLERETRILRNDERPWAERDHALFVAFAPVSAPRYALSVVVEHGGSGSRTAAPLAKAILAEVRRLEIDRAAEQES